MSYENLAGTHDAEDIFRLCLINKRRKSRIEIHLFTEDGDEVSVKEALSEVAKYVEDKMSSQEPNDVEGKVYPTMAQAVATALPKVTGIPLAAFLLSQAHIRYPLIQMMAIGFMLLKFIQHNKLKITTVEEPVTDEQIEQFERMAQASDLAAQGALTMGVSPKETLQKLYSQGQITQDDLRQLLNEKEEGDKDDNDGGDSKN